MQLLKNPFQGEIFQKTWWKDDQNIASFNLVSTCVFYMCPHDCKTSVLLHWRREASGFLCFTNFIFQYNIQKQLHRHSTRAFLLHCAKIARCSSAVPSFLQAFDWPTCHLILEVISPTRHLVSDIAWQATYVVVFRLHYLKISFFCPFFSFQTTPVPSYVEWSWNLPKQAVLQDLFSGAGQQLLCLLFKLTPPRLILTA